MQEQSKSWSNGKGWGFCETENYAQVLYRRATGELPEMESSKAAARIVSKWVNQDNSILDAGCGAGHYLRSLKKQIAYGFSYTGIDNSSLYVELAKKAFLSQDKVSFYKADIYKLPFADKSFDIGMSNNVFLHLPSIEKPLKELCRLCRKYILIRTLVGERSFRIQELRIQGDEFKADGQPKSFNYYNIYSRAYIERLLSNIKEVNSWEIVPDKDFDSREISANSEQSISANATKMVGNWQVNGYILQPWAFIKIFFVK